VIGTVV
jgi:hypothetical protein